MAEVVSAIPSAGGPYFWAAILSPPKWAPFASWVTGWFNLLGQVAVTTGITFGCANLISTLASMNGYEQSAGKTLGIYAALLFSHGIVNSFGVHILRYLNNTSIVLHSLGVFAFAVAVVAKAPKHQSAKFVFATFYDGTGDPGWSVRASPAYVACVGILMSQYTITGFDARSDFFPHIKAALLIIAQCTSLRRDPERIMVSTSGCVDVDWLLSRVWMVPHSLLVVQCAGF
jgi:amino acid transporter